MNFLAKNHIEMICSGQNTPIMEYVMVEHKVYVLKYTFLILKTFCRENYNPYPYQNVKILGLKMAFKWFFGSIYTVTIVY